MSTDRCSGAARLPVQAVCAGCRDGLIGWLSAALTLELCWLFSLCCRTALARFRQAQLEEGKVKVGSARLSD